METAQLDVGPVAEAHVACGGGDPCEEDWARYKSGFDRYRLIDMFGEELLQAARARVEKPRRYVQITLFISAAGLILSFTPFAGECLGWGWALWLTNLMETGITHILVHGFGAEGADAPCVLNGISQLLGIVSISVPAGEFEWPRAVYRAIDKALTVARLDKARLILAGSGQLRFTTGDCGVAVSGGNFEFKLNWGAVETAELVRKTYGLKVILMFFARIPSFDFDVIPKSASHLLIRLKLARSDELSRKDARKQGKNAPLKTTDILVIPEHFFHAPQDGNTWAEFLRYVSHHVCVGGWREE